MTEEKIWERPKSVPVPTVWLRYESKKPMANGVKPIFLIQDYTKEWEDQVIYNMSNYFLNDEPLSRYLDYTNDPEARDEFKEFVLHFLGRNMGLIAIVENLDELGDKNLPPLAGYNITAVVSSSDKISNARSPKIQKVLDALHVLEEKCDCFEYYKVKEFMYALGLSVDPAWRGHGLGHEILKARFPLCKAVGIDVTVTVFTSGAAQHSAKKAGFELLQELNYEDYKDENGEVVFKIKEPKSMKLMGLRIP